MYRCVAALAAALSIVFALPASAQVQRRYGAEALRGELVVVQPPVVTLNGQPARLAPGARIRAENNMLQLSGELLGRPLVVHYTLDGQGQLHDVWVLTEAERARQPWPTTREEAQRWSFDALAQAWTRR